MSSILSSARSWPAAPQDAENAWNLWRLHGSDARRRRVRRLLRLLEDALGQSDLLTGFESIADKTPPNGS